jgi:Protein of unknown function (DUF998)
MLTVCGVVAGPLFLATATIEGATRADYHPVRHPISSLALGPRGWVQTTNFAVTGGLYLASAAGMVSRARPAAAVFGTAGAALLVSAAFVTDPVNGYPPGTPDTPDPSSRTGAVHNLSAVPIFLGLPAVQLASAVRSARGNPRWAAYSAASAGGMLVGFVGASAGFSGSPRWKPYGGLFQRLAVVCGLGWLNALASRTLGSQTI